MLMSCSDYHIYRKLRWDRARALQEYARLAGLAVDAGITPRCHLEDITRADVEGFVLPLADELARVCGPRGFKLRLCDTLGLGLPFDAAPAPRGVPALVAALRARGLAPDQLEWHGHNDFHLAVANALALPFSHNLDGMLQGWVHGLAPGRVGPALQRRSRGGLVTAGMLRPVGPWPRVTRAHPGNGRSSALAGRRAGCGRLRSGAKVAAPEAVAADRLARPQPANPAAAIALVHGSSGQNDAASLREVDAVPVTPQALGPCPRGRAQARGDGWGSGAAPTRRGAAPGRRGYGRRPRLRPDSETCHLDLANAPGLNTGCPPCQVGRKRS